MAAALVRERKLWDPASPNLYGVTFELRRGGEVVDRVQSYFGFRSVEIQDGRVAINGRRGIAWIPPGAQVPESSWGYAGVEKSSEAALARLRGLYEGIAATRAFIGIRYTQLTDVEQEINGLMTYDRKLKFDASRLREINGLPQ